MAVPEYQRIERWKVHVIWPWQCISIVAGLQYTVHALTLSTDEKAVHNAQEQLYSERPGLGDSVNTRLHLSGIHAEQVSKQLVR